MEEFKKWECIVCGWIYDEEQGLPEEGIEPGTKWEDVPVDWVCPDCGVGKEDFDMVPLEVEKVTENVFHQNNLTSYVFGYFLWQFS